MRSPTKSDVSIDQIKQLIKAHSGSHSDLLCAEELTAGFFNAAYRLDFTNGSSAVLKVAPPDSNHLLRYERNIMQAEVESLRMVRRQTSVPVPEVLFYDDTKAFVPADCFVMTFVPGTAFSDVRKKMSQDDQEKVEWEAAGYLRQMNSICGERFGYLAQDYPGGTCWANCFLQMVEGVLLDGEEAGVKLPVSYKELRKLFQRAVIALDEVKEPRLVHWDLWDGNIFVDSREARITGMIDFERALWGDPLMEVNFGGLEKRPAFLDAYGESMLSTPEQMIRRSAYNLYLYLIMIIECSYRQYDDPGQKIWATGMLVKELLVYKSLTRK